MSRALPACLIKPGQSARRYVEPRTKCEKLNSVLDLLHSSARPWRLGNLGRQREQGTLGADVVRLDRPHAGGRCTDVDKDRRTVRRKGCLNRAFVCRRGHSGTRSGRAGTPGALCSDRADRGRHGRRTAISRRTAVHGRREADNAKGEDGSKRARFADGQAGGSRRGRGAGDTAVSTKPTRREVSASYNRCSNGPSRISVGLPAHLDEEAI